MLDKWDCRFLRLAEFISSWSRDPSKNVGAVIVDQKKRIVSLGFNGFPRGVDDDHRLNDQNLKNEIVIHAEINALLFANKDVQGCTLYVWPIPPCSRCAAQIIQSGIARVVAPYIEEADRWKASVQLGRDVLDEGGVHTDYVPKGFVHE